MTIFIMQLQLTCSWCCILLCRLCGFGEHCVPLSKQTEQTSCNLLLAHPKFPWLGLLLWKEWMVFRSSRSTETTVLLTDSLQPTLGIANPRPRIQLVTIIALSLQLQPAGLATLWNLWQAALYAVDSMQRVSRRFWVRLGILTTSICQMYLL